MTEGLFILTVIFVAYAVYVAVGEQKATVKSQEPEVQPEAVKLPVEQPKHEVIPKKEKPPIPSSAVIKKTTTAAPTDEVIAKKEKSPTQSSPVTKKTTPAASNKKGLRNPETGEVATSYTNYRFTKRWIKDALVAEGLVDKVYKNNELDAATEAKIKAAMVKLEGIDKYKV
ncbi:MAG: hypothetical protein PHG00_02005 [Methylococcales bacterium]|nr:hypothetical protein [Methylococcales bacterium]